MGWHRYLIRRFPLALAQFVGMTLLVFLIVQLAPGSAIDYYISNNPFATEDYIRALQVRMGLDLPPWRQYLHWLLSLSRGDLGLSLSHPGTTVFDLLASRIMNSFILSVAANVLSVAIAIPVGVVAAARRGSLVDGIFRLLTLFGYSVPSFWLAILLIEVFAVRLEWLPSFGFITVPDGSPFSAVLADGLLHAILPILVLGFIGATLTSRIVRSSMLDVLGEDYVRTARAKGLSEWVVLYRHALQNALLPVVTVIGLQVGFLLASATVIETVFAWPGLGRAIILASIARDYPVVMGVTVVVGATIIIINLLTDMLYTRLDPRVRYG